MPVRSPEHAGGVPLVPIALDPLADLACAGAREQRSRPLEFREHELPSKSGGESAQTRSVFDHPASRKAADAAAARAGPPNTRERTRVIIADDHPLFRDGLARRVQERPDLELVGQAADGNEVIELVRALKPDVAVVDLKMPGGGGLGVARALTREALTTHLVLLSAHLDSALVFEALAAGARAFVSKDADRLEVCETIVAVARGDVVLPAWLHAGLASEIRTRARDADPALTARELDVLRLIAEGRSAPAVGRALHLSTGTVKSHLTSVYEKLGVNDRAAAVAEGMRRGVLE